MEKHKHVCKTESDVEEAVAVNCLETLVPQDVLASILLLQLVIIMIIMDITMMLIMIPRHVWLMIIMKMVAMLMIMMMMIMLKGLHDDNDVDHDDDYVEMAG